MRRLILLFVFIFSFVFSFSQKNETIQIIEKKEKYRVELYAINTTNTDKNISLFIQGQGFRRSSFKPVSKTVKAKDTVLLTTLFKLKYVPNHFVYDLFYGDNLEELNKKITLHKQQG